MTVDVDKWRSNDLTENDSFLAFSRKDMVNY